MSILPESLTPPPLKHSWPNVLDRMALSAKILLLLQNKPKYRPGVLQLMLLTAWHFELSTLCELLKEKTHDFFNYAN